MQVTEKMLEAYKIAHRAAVDAALNDYGKIATIGDDARRAGISAALSEKQAAEVKAEYSHEDRVTLASCLSWDINEITPSDVKGILERLEIEGYRLVRSALVDVPVEPVDWLRSCRITYLSGEERDGHVVTNKHDPRAFPVYISPPLSHRGEDSAVPVQDTWFTDRALPVMAMSADVESNRILKLHFRRPVTDDDRKALCDALNMHQAAIAATRSGSATNPSGGDR